MTSQSVQQKITIQNEGNQTMKHGLVIEIFFFKNYAGNEASLRFFEKSYMK